MTAAADTLDLAFPVGERRTEVSARLVRPGDAFALYVLAHGAGAGMRHPFMEDMAQRLALRGVATLRYQFPYMEEGKPRPDPPARSMATVRAAAEKAKEVAGDLFAVAGGKSFGGRMTSTAAAQKELVGIRGLIFLGFPLHAPKRQGTERADHLSDVLLPMLFLQGTRDALADLSLLGPIVRKLGPSASLHVIDDGDHSFKVPKRAGREMSDVMDELADTIVEWIRAIRH